MVKVVSVKSLLAHEIMDNFTFNEMLKSLDEDLSCSVCRDQLIHPFLRCSNGHNTCSRCVKTNNFQQCPLCQAPIFVTPTPSSPLYGETSTRTQEDKFTFNEMLKALDEDLSCSICRYQLIHPVLQCSNGHNTCSRCVKTNNFQQCPLCQAPIFVPPHRTFGGILPTLPTPCIYAGAGCPHPVSDSHQPHFCLFRPIKCPLRVVSPCSWSGTVKNWLEHTLAHPSRVFDDIGFTTQLDFFLILNVCYNIRVQDNHFLLITSLRSGMFSLTVKHVLTHKPTEDYFFTIFFEDEKSIYQSTLKPSLFKENQDDYEDCLRMDVPISALQTRIIPMYGLATSGLIHVTAKNIVQ